MDREATRHQGGAYNALMDEETKESLALLCCKLMDDLADLKEKLRRTSLPIREFSSESMIFPEAQ